MEIFENLKDGELQDAQAIFTWEEFIQAMTVAINDSGHPQSHKMTSPQMGLCDVVIEQGVPTRIAVKVKRIPKKEPEEESKKEPRNYFIPLERQSPEEEPEKTVERVIPFEPELDIWDDLRALIDDDEMFESVKKVVSAKIENDRAYFLSLKSQFAKK